MTTERARAGVPAFECSEYADKTSDYVVLIPIINEGERILEELYRAYKRDISNYADIVICDGGSTDGCTDEKKAQKTKGQYASGKEGCRKTGCAAAHGNVVGASKGLSGDYNDRWQ